MIQVPKMLNTEIASLIDLDGLTSSYVDIKLITKSNPVPLVASSITF